MTKAPSHSDLVRYAEALGESLLKATLRVTRQIEIIEGRRRMAGAEREPLTVEDGIRDGAPQ